MTNEEYELALSIRSNPRFAKFDARELQRIWNNEHPDSQHNSCLCTSSERQEFKCQFYNWFNNIEQPYD